MQVSIKWCGIVVVVAAAVVVSGCQTTKVNPETAKIAVQLPIADLHMHPVRGLTADAAKDRMDRNNVRWAGAGVKKGGGSRVWREHANELGARFIAFAGQSELNKVYRSGGIAAMEDAGNAGIQALARAAERDLKKGRIKGIGEIFINNSRHPDSEFRRKGRTDAPSMRMLFDLVARYDGFLTLHMQTHSDSVSEMERLLQSNRRGRILWNHCGVDSEPSDIRPLLRRHPNLFCELSIRYPPVPPPRWSRFYVFDRSGPLPAWLKLIEAFPDRFMIGTDAHNDSEYDGAIAMVRRGLLPYLRPATARMVAYENAQRLFDLR